MIPTINQALSVSETILIHATPSRVWAALITPSLIKEYLFGTETSTDWKVGSPITFSGEFGPDKQRYCDKGVILENVPAALLRYSYWSGFSGLADSLANYGTITYRLEKSDQGTQFTWAQQGFVDEARRQHTQGVMPAILAQIKAIAER